MKGPGHILRSVAAILLLGIFISIHIAKAFHSHTSVSSLYKSADAKESIQASSACDICDYHFTKEGAAAITPEALVITQPFTSVFRFYKSHTSSSIGLHYSDRGPPVFA